MFDKVRRHINPTSALAVTALVFAMTGGAYAATHVIIKSIGQISPKVRHELKGDTGPAGKQGAAGNPGAAGKEGPQGPQGPQGSIGAVLPSGVSETGAWSDQSIVEGAAVASISFPIQLEAALDSEHVFFLEPGQEDLTHCPGSVGSPAASRGDLCVYAKGLTANMTPFAGKPVEDPSQNLGTAGAAVSGANILLLHEGTELGTAYGTWAVTAP